MRSLMIACIILCFVVLGGCDDVSSPTAPSGPPPLQDPGEVVTGEVATIAFPGCPGNPRITVTRLLPKQGSSTPTLPPGSAGPLCSGPNKACFEIDYRGNGGEAARNLHFVGAFSTNGSTPDAGSTVITFGSFDGSSQSNYWYFFYQGQVPKTLLFWVFDHGQVEWEDRLCEAALPLDYTGR